AGGVGHVEGVRDLHGIIENLLDGDGLAFDAMLQSDAVEKLHDNERVALVFADVVNCADIGMIEGGGGAGFSAKAFESLGIGREILREKFESYAAAKALVLGFIDDPHAAATQLLENLVMRDGLAKQQGATP